MSYNVGDLVATLKLDSKPFDKSISALSKKVGDMGKTLSKTLTAPLVAFGVAGVIEAGKVEDAINKLNTLDLSQGKKEMEQYTEKLKTISKDSGIALKDLAESAYQAGSATGGLTADTIDYVNVAVRSGVAGFSSTVEAIDGLTSVMNVYGLTGEEAMMNISDKMLATQNVGKTTAQEIGKGIGGVSSLGKAIGVTFDEVLTGVAELTKGGNTTSEAFTGLEGVFKAILKPTTQASELADELGITLGATAMNGKSFSEFLKEMTEKTGGSSEALSVLFGGVEGLKSILQLATDEGINGFNNSLALIGDSAGATNSAYDKMKDKVSDYQLAMNKLSLVMVEVGGKVQKALAPIVEVIGNIADSFLSLDENTQVLLVVIGGLLALLPLLMVAFGPILKTVGLLVKVFALVSSPIGLIIAAIGILVITLGILYTKNEAFRTAVNQLWEQIKDAIKSVIDSIIVAISAFMDMLSAFWETHGDKIIEIVTVYMDIIKVVIDTVLKVITGIFNVFADIFKGDWKSALNGVKEIVSTIFNAIREIFTITFTFFIDIVRDKLNTAKDTISNILNNIGDYFSKLPGKAREWGINFIKGFVDGIKSMISSVTNAVKGVIDGAKDFIGFNSPSKKGDGRYIVQWGENLIGGFIEGINNAKSELTNTMNGVSHKLNIGVSEPSTNGNSQPFYITGNNFTVRNDADINSIAIKLEQLRKRNTRNGGIR